MFAYLARTVAKMALVLVVAVPAICASTKVHAQDGAQNETNERLRACDRIADTMEKLACFDAVVKSLDQKPHAPLVVSPAAPATTEAAPTTPASDDAAKSSAAEAAPAAVATVAPPVTETQSTATTVTPPVTETQSTATTVTPAVTDTKSAAVAPALPATDKTTEPGAGSPAGEEMFGLNDASGKSAGLKSIRATIVDAWPTIDGRFEARLDNGQVWRETSRTRTQRPPKAGTPVVISRGRFGSFRMKIGNDNRLAGVRRTQ